MPLGLQHSEAGSCHLSHAVYGMLLQQPSSQGTHLAVWGQSELGSEVYGSNCRLPVLKHTQGECKGGSEEEEDSRATGLLSCRRLGVKQNMCVWEVEAPEPGGRPRGCTTAGQASCSGVAQLTLCRLLCSH